MNRRDPSAVEQFIPRINQTLAEEGIAAFLSGSAAVLDSGEEIKLDASTLWGPQQPRSIGRKAHGWFFLRSLTSGVSSLDSREAKQIVACVISLVPQWLAQAADDSTMAFHDETTAQRLINFSAFLRSFGNYLDNEESNVLLQVVENDIARLTDPSFYAGKNNHGMFQDVALLVAYNYFDFSDDIENLAVSRLHDYFSECFTVEGVHVENNPSYHLMVASYLRKFIDYLETRELSSFRGDLHGLLEKADRYAAFALTPSGTYPPISDTAPGRIGESRAIETFETGHLLAAITQGRSGKLPKSLTYSAPASGYAIARSGWDTDDAFLFFSAAYNSDYHKHSDELSLYLCCNGYELLREAGPNGYQYDDPFTRYAFSSLAHNTLLVDGKGLPRIDSNSDKTFLEDFSTQHEFDVKGRTLRFNGVDWSRSVSFEGKLGDNPIRVTDRVESDETRELRFLWHFGPKIRSQIRGNFIELFASDTDKKVCEIYIKGCRPATVELISNRRHPNIQGIYFPRMGENAAAEVAEFSFDLARACVLDVTWEIRLSNFLLEDRGINPANPEWQTFHGEQPVHYMVDNRERAAQGVAIVFSAVSPLFNFTYNYRSSLKDYPGAVVYVLDDFGDQGAYYLAGNRNFSIYRSVQSCLRSVLKDLKTAPSKAITIGSSKGGTAAIIHGVGLGVSSVYAGGPQYRVGDFTQAAHPNILEYIAGGTAEGDIFWLNRVIERLLLSGDRTTQINVVVGESDGHYRKHAVPLVDRARSLGYRVHLLRTPGVTHSELGAAFRVFLKGLSHYSSRFESDYSLPHVFGYDTKTSELGVAVALPPGAVGLAQLQINGDNHGRTVRLTNGHARWKVNAKGVARARIYIEEKEGEPRRAFGTSAIRL